MGDSILHALYLGCHATGLVYYLFADTIYQHAGVRGLKEVTMHPALLNGKPRVTLIESFDGKVTLIRSREKHRCKSLEEAKELVERMGWEINIDFIKGTQIKRGLT